MQPPLPEVPKNAPVSKAKPAFLGLSVVVITDLIFSWVSVINNLFFVRYEPDEWMFFSFVVVGVFACLYTLVDYFLWRGFNWARRVVLFLSITSLIYGVFGEYFFPADESEWIYPEIAGIFNVVYGIWNFVIVSWLLLPNIARHFKNPRPI